MCTKCAKILETRQKCATRKSRIFLAFSYFGTLVTLKYQYLRNKIKNKFIIYIKNIKKQVYMCAKIRTNPSTADFVGGTLLAQMAHLSHLWQRCRKSIYCFYLNSSKTSRSSSFSLNMIHIFYLIFHLCIFQKINYSSLCQRRFCIC